MINVLVVDDHELVLIGIKTILSKCDDISLVEIARNGSDAIALVDKLAPDIVVLDIDLPDMSGLDVATIMLKGHPKLKIIFHTSYVDEEHIVKSFDIGAMGYIPKNFNPIEFIDAIRIVNNGEKYLKGVVSKIFIESYFNSKTKKIESSRSKLTKRECEILKLIVDGNTNADIARLLFISVRTAEAHKSNIMNKLEIYNTADLVKYAIKHKIIEVN